MSRRRGKRPATTPGRWRSRWTPRPRSPWGIMSVGGKTRTSADGEVARGWDHDPPAKEKLTPFGILMVASGALMLVFGSQETSDAWVDVLRLWWTEVRSGLGQVKRLVIYLDNGPKKSGRRRGFLEGLGGVRG